MADYATTILAEPGLVAYYKQNETGGATTATDQVATAANGTYTNTGALTQGVTPTGITTNTPADTGVDYARGGNTAGGHIAIGSNTKFNPTTAFTIECWLRLDSNLAASAFYTIWARLTSGANQTGAYSFYLTNPTAGATNAVRMECELFSNALSTLTSSTTFTFTLGTWFHVACMWNGSNVSFWVNGTQVGTNLAKTGTMSAWNTGPAIARYGTGSDYFDGATSHTATYTAAIGSTAIADHYTTGTSPSVPVDNTTKPARPGMFDPELVRRMWF